MNIKNLLLVLSMATAATSMQAMNQQGAGAGAGAQQAAEGLALIGSGVTQIGAGFFMMSRRPALMPVHMTTATVLLGAGAISSEFDYMPFAAGDIIPGCTRALTHHVIIDDAITKTMKLIADSDKAVLSKEEQLKLYEAEVKPLLKLYHDLGFTKKSPLASAEESKKSAEAVAADLSKNRTAKTFGVLFAFYRALGDSRFEGVAEKA